MFFTFNQNNSGGGFDYNGETGITHYVVIEADSPEDANDKARSVGIYFDGVEAGIDCDCCGDRWYELWDGSGGHEVPTVYGRPVSDIDWGTEYAWMGGDPEVFIHYADGSLIGYGPRIRSQLGTSQSTD